MENNSQKDGQSLKGSDLNKTGENFASVALSEYQSELHQTLRHLPHPIKQTDSTIFKVHPVEWNNVPSVVYSAVCTLIT